MKNNGYISVIGGSNMDIIGFPYKELILKDSNPGQVKIALGGVGRNIAENLVMKEITWKEFFLTSNQAGQTCIWYMSWSATV